MIRGLLLRLQVLVDVPGKNVAGPQFTGFVVENVDRDFLADYLDLFLGPVDDVPIVVVAEGVLDVVEGIAVELDQVVVIGIHEDVNARSSPCVCKKAIHSEIIFRQLAAIIFPLVVLLEKILIQV